MEHFHIKIAEIVIILNISDNFQTQSDLQLYSE